MESQFPIHLKVHQQKDYSSVGRNGPHKVKSSALDHSGNLACNV